MSRQDVRLRGGALAEVGRILDDHGASRLLFVVDESAYAASGATDTLENVFAARRVERFVGFELNPKLHDIRRGIAQCRKFQPDMVIAFGGGTAIDLAKLIAALAMHQEDAREMITGQCAMERSGLPLIAIPTTAGTGSEATHFAVAYVDAEKYSLAHPFLLPEYAIIDHEMTSSLPPRETAASGLDAFCQAIESMWAVGANEESLRYATEAARLALEHLRQAVERPTADARRGMCQAAHLSGKAINISKTTAPHALSYAITTDYGVPHGMAVAMMLGPMLKYNAAVTASDCNDPRGPKYVLDRVADILNVLQAADIATACGKIRDLISATASPTSLSDFGVTDDAAIERLVGQVNADRLSNNPRRTTSASLFALLKSSSLESACGSKMAS